MVFRFLVFLFLFVLGANKVRSQIPLLSIGSTEISTEEFLFVYNKNKYYQDALPLAQSIDRYLELFINFKLKVLEAYNLGLDQTIDYKQEVAQYRKQLAEPYLTDYHLTEKILLETYERMLVEVKVSHLLIKVNNGDTALALQKAWDLRRRIQAGEDFSKIATEESKDPSASSNKGLLGYFSVFRTVYPFETAAYNTEVGEVSEPVVTKFGIHLIKVHSNRPSRGRVKVSQIMIRKSPDSVAANRKVEQVYERLRNGEPWEKLCLEYSDDSQTSRLGGRLPWFGTGQMIPEFEDAAFGLDSAGQVSQPVVALYGWHILKLDQRNQVGSFEESREWLESMVRRDSRGTIPRLRLIDKLKGENDWVPGENLDTMLNYWEKEPQWRENLYGSRSDSLVLFRIETKAYTTIDFEEYLSRNKPQQPNQDFTERYESFENAMILEYEEAHLERKHPEFRMLYQEYREGVLLFELMQREVWEKAMEDSLGIKRFYDDHPEKYKNADRAEVLIITANGEAEAIRVWQILQALSKEDTAGNQVTALSIVDQEAFIKEKYSLEVRLREDTFEAGSEPFPVVIRWEEGSQHSFESEGHNLVVVRRIEPGILRDLQEIKGTVISDYQDFLETSWVSVLRKKYHVSVNKKELKSLIKRLENL